MEVPGIYGVCAAFHTGLSVSFAKLCSVGYTCFHSCRISSSSRVPAIRLLYLGDMQALSSLGTDSIVYFFVRVSVCEGETTRSTRRKGRHNNQLLFPSRKPKQSPALG